MKRMFVMWRSEPAIFCKDSCQSNPYSMFQSSSTLYGEDHNTSNILASGSISNSCCPVKPNPILYMGT